MPKIVPIVEGPGDVSAVPILCNKILWGDFILRDNFRHDVHIDTPLDTKGRSNLTKEDGLERWVERAWDRRDCAAILILVDLDAGCSVNLARSFTSRILAMGTPKCTVVTVVAKMEYEAWFLASLATIVGATIRPGFSLPAELTLPEDVEMVRDAKKWLTDQIPLVGGRRRTAYDEARDQAALTRLIDTTLARERSRSFRRLRHAIEQILDAIDNNKIVVTPEVEP